MTDEDGVSDLNLPIGPMTALRFTTFMRELLAPREGTSRHKELSHRKQLLS